MKSSAQSFTDFEKRLAALETTSADLTLRENRLDTTLEQRMQELFGSIGMAEETATAAATTATSTGQTTAQQTTWLWLGLLAVAAFIILKARKTIA